MTRSKVVFLS